MKRFVYAVLVVAMAWSAAGCGSTTEHDAAVDYTPGSLAQELAFRYRSLSPSAKKATKNRSEARDKALAATEREAVAKGRPKAAAKKAQAENIDDVLDEIADKARAIPRASPAETFQKMAETITHDQSLDANDRQTLADKLNEMAQAAR